MAHAKALLQTEPSHRLANILAPIPGVILLVLIGYPRKVIEKSLEVYSKAHHRTYSSGKDV